MEIPQHCVPCKAMKVADRIDKQAADDRCRSLLPGWHIVEHSPGVLALQREFKFSNFKLAMEFANQVADMAEDEEHHPTLVVSWGQVQATWFSFSIKGLHINDFVCAQKTQQIFDRIA